MSEQPKDARVFVLDRGFRWIGPFFAALTPFAAWSFFVDKSEPPDTSGGVLVIALLGAFAVWSHATWVRTRVIVDSTGVTVRNILEERHAEWREIVFARVEGTDLVFHLAAGRRLKASSYLAGFGSLIELVERRGILRSRSEAPMSGNR